MKRTLSLLMACILLLGLMAGCGDGNADRNSGGSSAPQGDTAPANGTEPSKDAPQDVLNVALVVAGSLGDKGFNDSAKAGVDMAAESYGVTSQIVELPSSDKTKFEPTLLDLADTGKYDLIIASGNAMREILEKVSKEYPEQKFYLFDAAVDYSNGAFENVYCNTFLQNEASFLAGVVAAGMTTSGALENLNEDNLVGNVLLMDMAVINDFMVGFIEGCQYVDPDIKINSAYIGGVDAAKAKDIAMAMYQQKADIVFQVAASAGLGVIEAGKEQKGYVIGVDSDQAMALAETDPDAANRILTSVLKRSDMAIYRVISMMRESGVPWGTSEALGMEQECVGIAKNEIYEKLVTAEVREMVEDAEKKIASGEISVGTAYGMETDAITQLRDSVKP